MAKKQKVHPLMIFAPTRRKMKCFGWIALVACILFAFILKGVDVWMLVWGWVLLWPMLLLSTAAGGLTSQNIFTTGLLGMVLLVIYWYVFACVWITLKDYIES